MSKKLKFVWIDDNPEDRKSESRNMSRRLGVSIDFKDVKNNDLTECLENLLKGHQPDLILIDHKFDDNSTGIFKTGSTVAALIRDSWPSCPVVCVTGVNLEDVDSQKRALYDAVFQFHEISKHDDTILSIAKSFNRIKSKRPNSVEELLQLLKAPKSEYSKLEAILPDKLKHNFGDKGYPTNIARWVRNVLMKRPGFLYNRLWTATMLGIKENSFHKVEDLFTSAKYKGIFADSSQERWWKAKLLEILTEQVNKTGLSYEKGRELEGITKRDFSKCHVDGSDFPETVAYEDDAPLAKEYPMRLKNTIPHPEYEDMLFFEEIRLMKPQ